MDETCNSEQTRLVGPSIIQRMPRGVGRFAIRRKEPVFVSTFAPSTTATPVQDPWGASGDAGADADGGASSRPLDLDWCATLVAELVGEGFLAPTRDGALVGPDGSIH
jgi:hypothetical protein